MSAPGGRLVRLAGTPYEIGVAMGRHLGPRLERSIARYLAGRAPHVATTPERRRDALNWLRTLPERYQQEYDGLAAGAGLALERVAEWPYIEVSDAGGCSSALVELEGQVWVARNNDWLLPELWGYASVKAVRGRIPALTFGMEGDVFSGTGVNQQRLWLHYHYLPAVGAPPDGALWPCHVWLVEALETCGSLADVEALLASVPRDGAMLLFAVDGKNNARALYQCEYASYRAVDVTERWLMGGNHRLVGEEHGADADSQRRCDRLQTLVSTLDEAQSGARSPAGALRKILADDGVEARAGDSVTVYANVACPAMGELWYTWGGHPAASAGRWERLEWPWQS